MSTDNKVYILQKDLSRAKAGAKFTTENDNSEYYNTNFASYLDRIHKSRVENNPEWFKEEPVYSSQPISRDTWIVTDNFKWTDELVKEYARSFGYAGEPSIEEFKKENQPKVQGSGEPSPTQDKEEQKPITHIMDNMDTFNYGYRIGYKDANKYNDKKYTESELLKAQENAFDAARETDCSTGSWLGHLQTKEGATFVYKTKYPTFNDYITKNQK